MRAAPSSRALALLLAGSLLAACGGDGDDDAAPASSTSSTTAVEPTLPGADPEPPPGAPDLDAVSVRLTEVARLDDPTVLAVRPGHDDVLFVAERAGRIRAVVDGEVADEPVLDLDDETTTEAERGLLGLAFSPDGRHLYVSYTGDDGTSHLDEYAFGEAATAIDRGSRRPVLEIEQPYPNHNGGNVVFGPDGFLYASFGDGGAAGDPQGNAQDPSTLLGDMLRIDPRPAGDEPYGIPPGNPFVGGGGRPEVWATGLRNPWRFSFDRATGDLWIADVGQDDVEEVNLVPAGTGAGANFGWPLMEGSETFDGSDGPPPGHTGPVFEYPSEGARCSVTGGHVYRGTAIPALVGAYVWGDYCEGEVHATVVAEGRPVATRPLGLSVEPGTLVSFGEDAAGELHVLSFEGALYRIDPA